MDPGEEDAAVAATLAARLRHVRNVEFEMELEVAEPFLSHDIAAADREDAIATGQSAGVLPSSLTQPLERFAIE